MNENVNQIACAGCGCLIAPGEQINCIVEGKLGEDGRVRNKKVWAWLHRGCFRRSVRSPTAALEEIRSQVAAHE